MKVTCKCCHKVFDYDMYMGLCPKCGRVYRRGAGHYSVVEKDMLGDFHLHADEGGLNRGIHGVVYNQGSSETERTNLNGYDTGVIGSIAKAASGGTSGKASYNKPQPATLNKAQPATLNKSQPASYKAQLASYSKTQTAAKNPYSSQATPKDVVETIKTSTGNGYYSDAHKTKMNQQVSSGRKQGNHVGAIIFVMIILYYIVSTIYKH